MRVRTPALVVSCAPAQHTWSAPSENQTDPCLCQVSAPGGGADRWQGRKGALRRHHGQD